MILEFLWLAEKNCNAKEEDMRYLRLATIFIFIVACAVLCWTLYSLSLQDTTAPQITDSLGDLHLSVTEDSNALLKGLTAADDWDGDLTDRILVERVSRFSEPGVCQVHYVVFDSGNNFCRYQRTVTYDDYVSPRLELEKPLLYRQGEQISIIERVRLMDCIDGDISHMLKIEASNVPGDTAGIFEIEFYAINSYGDEIFARVPLNIYAYSADAPQIQLKQYLAYTTAGEDFSPLAYLESVQDKTGASIPVNQVKVFNQVDLTKPGGGQVCFEVTDQFGVTGLTYLTVIVEEP